MNCNFLNLQNNKVLRITKILTKMDLLNIILIVLVSIIIILIGFIYYYISKEEDILPIPKEELIQCLMEYKEKFKI